MNKRSLAREMALQMLYQSDLGGSASAQVCQAFDPGEYAGEPDNGAAGGESDGERQTRRLEEAFEYSKALVQGALEHRDQIDDMIRQQADNWRLERMPGVDRNILRLAVYELLYEADVPKLVVIDEAIELAKKFGSENSGRFINGLLDGLLKRHAFPGSLT